MVIRNRDESRIHGHEPWFFFLLLFFNLREYHSSASLPEKASCVSSADYISGVLIECPEPTDKRAFFPATQNCVHRHTPSNNVPYVKLLALLLQPVYKSTIACIFCFSLVSFPLCCVGSRNVKCYSNYAFNLNVTTKHDVEVQSFA